MKTAGQADTRQVDQFRAFKPPGPVAAGFIADTAHKVNALLGPVGGGKTVSCIYRTIRRASRMPPCNDGMIRYRRAVIGSTYGQMERNLYPSWQTWMPLGDNSWTPNTWTGGGGRFARHVLEWDVLRGNRLVPVHCEVIFAAIGDLVVEEFMRGFEPTDLWLFEMDQLVEAVLDVGLTRIGRFPRTGTAPDAIPAAVPFLYGIDGDLNAPDFDSWFVKRFEENRPANFKLHKQPSGRSPKAENRGHLRPSYYDDMIEALEKKSNGRHLIKRMVDAQYAPSLDGEPVYPEYDDSVHLLADIAPLRDVPIILGFDQGLQRPAAVAAQLTSRGQWRILFEVVPGRMNGRRFAEAVKLKLQEVAPGIPLAELHYCDPAGAIGADKEGGDIAWNEIVGNELGITIVPTETNEIDARLTAVKDELTYSVEPGVPALVISKAHCPMLRKGFASHYRFKREKVGSGERTSDKPEKTDESNPHDGLQYLILGKKGRHGVIAGRRDALAPERDWRGQGRPGDGCRVLDAPVHLG